MANDFIQSLLQGAQMINQALQFQTQIMQQQKQLDQRREHEEALVEAKKATLAEQEKVLDLRKAAQEETVRANQARESLGYARIEATNARAQLDAKNNPARVNDITKGVQNKLRLTGSSPEEQHQLNVDARAANKALDDFTKEWGGQVKGAQLLERSRLQAVVEGINTKLATAKANENAIVEGLPEEDKRLYFGHRLNQAEAKPISDTGPEPPPKQPETVKANASIDAVKDVNAKRLAAQIESLSQLGANGGFAAPANRAVLGMRLNTLAERYKATGRPLAQLAVDLKNVQGLDASLIRQATVTLRPDLQAELYAALGQ